MEKNILKPISLIILAIRNFRTNEASPNKYFARESRFMTKMMGDANKKKKDIPFATPVSPTIRSSTSIDVGAEGARRVNVLNKLFMTHITDMMATGHSASEIIGRGVEISRVAVSRDVSVVKVFWLAKGSEDDAYINTLLVNLAPELRHELTQLRVIGMVPQIMFIKDMHYSKTAEVERLLKIADFGEDFNPSGFGSDFKNKPTMRDLKMESDNADELIPKMSMDVFGLDHAKIMSKVMISLEKSKALHRNKESSCFMRNAGESSTDEDMPSAKLQHTQISKFLLQRRLRQDQDRKREKNFQPEYQMYEEEAEKDVREQFVDDYVDDCADPFNFEDNYEMAEIKESEDFR